MPDWPWDFYAIVGGSLALAFLIIYLGKQEDRREAKVKAKAAEKDLDES